MRCVQNGKFGYIYNPFSDGKHWYRNNNEGKTMAAMNAAAETDQEIAKRVHLFRYRVPEEFYDLENDPDCLVNLIDSPEHKADVQNMREKLEAWMVDTEDPMLEAFRSRDDRAAVDAVMEKTYGKPKQQRKRKKARKNQ